MCTSNSDCSGGAQCVNGTCQGGSNPPTKPPIPPLSDIESEIVDDEDVD